MKDAKFEIRISDGISWEEIKYFQSEVDHPETIDEIDIYAGQGSIHHMKAYYRYLVWSNTMRLFLVKPSQECFTIKEWGPIFRIKFRLYVASLPEKPNKVCTWWSPVVNIIISKISSDECHHIHHVQWGTLQAGFLSGSQC